MKAVKMFAPYMYFNKTPINKADFNDDFQELVMVIDLWYKPFQTIETASIQYLCNLYKVNHFNLKPFKEYCDPLWVFHDWLGIRTCSQTSVKC